MRITAWVAGVFLFTASAEVRKFTIPADLLKEWSGKVTSEMAAVRIGGNSKVHALASDCEIHFGAKSANFAGRPSGLVLEPMNACEFPFPGKTKYAKKDWMAFAASLKDKTVTIEGVPRIWPEHLGDPDDPDGGPPSNPNHAVEFHPLTAVTVGSKTHDFSKAIYAPDGFTGGLSAGTAEKILTDTEITVSLQGGDVEVSFDSGRIGNFTTLELRIKAVGIETAPGGHRMTGRVILGRNKSQDVTLVTVAGSPVDARVEKLRARARGTTSLEGLVLFGLDPQQLLRTARAGGGMVERPLQLVLFGEVDDEE